MAQAVDRIRMQLDHDLREHELAIEKLQTLQEQVQSEIELHELLITLGRNGALLDYIEQLAAEGPHLASLRSEGLSDEQRHRMEVPPGVGLEVTGTGTSLSDLRMSVRHKAWHIEVIWHDTHGLIVRPIEGPKVFNLATLPLELADEERSSNLSQTEPPRELA